MYTVEDTSGDFRPPLPLTTCLPMLGMKKDARSAAAPAAVSLLCGGGNILRVRAAEREYGRTAAECRARDSVRLAHAVLS